MKRTRPSDARFLRRALLLARRGLGRTSPNPMVGAVLVKQGRILGEGWHRRAGDPHAEIEALDDCRRHGFDPRGSILFVTLEPCSTHGRTPPCTDALLAAGVREVVVAATDPNPRHAGRGLDLLRAGGVRVRAGLMAGEATRLNAAFNHWIVHRSPRVTLKAAMTLDGKIATATGDSRWITGEAARRAGMRMRREHDAILVGVNTVLADDPRLTVRHGGRVAAKWRVVLDTQARTPLRAQLLNDQFRERTLIVVGDTAPHRRLRALQSRAGVITAPAESGRIDLVWLLQELGRRSITSILVEGGGEVHASFLELGLAHRVAFFYAPKVLGGRTARPAVSGAGFANRTEIPTLVNVLHRRLGTDLLLTGDVRYPATLGGNPSATEITVNTPVNSPRSIPKSSAVSNA